MKDIINRILEVKEYLKLRTDADFADYLSINRSNFSQMIQGKRSIGDSILNKISIQADINKSWLLTGEGEMFKPLEGNTVYYIQAHKVDEYISQLGTSNNKMKVASFMVPHLTVKDSYFFAFDVIDDRLSRGIEPALRVNDIVITELTSSRDSFFFMALIASPVIVVILSDKYGQLIRKVADCKKDEIILSPTHPIYIHDKKEHIRVKIKDIKLLGIVKKIIVNDPVFVIDNSIDDDKYFLANSTPL